MSFFATKIGKNPEGAKPSRESPSVFHQLVKNPSGDNKLTKTNKQKRQMAKRKTHTHKPKRIINQKKKGEKTRRFLQNVA